MGRNNKGHRQSITLDAELSTIIRGHSRGNYDRLRDIFGVEIQGSDTLSIQHSNAETLSAFVGFFKDTLMVKAEQIRTEGRAKAEKPEDYRPSEKEIKSFESFVETSVKDYVSKACQTVVKVERGQVANKSAKAAQNAAANGSGSVKKPLFTLPPFEFRGPNDGEKQKALMAAVTDTDTDLVFSIGRSGSGKTYVSLAAALSLLEQQKIEKIYVIRPYVPSGRHRMGDVPGDESRKLRGLMSGVVGNVNQILGKGVPGRDTGVTFENLVQKGLIELQPLDKIRSMSFHNCVVLVTEAQNVDYDQSDILMRIGENCTFILDGSFEQKDMVVAYSSLIDWAIRYADDAATPFVYFNSKDDCVRSPQSARHAAALERAMPAGYQDIRPLTPEFSRNAGMMQATKANVELACKLVEQAAERTLDKYAATPRKNNKLVRFDKR